MTSNLEVKCCCQAMSPAPMPSSARLRNAA